MADEDATPIEETQEDEAAFQERSRRVPDFPVVGLGASAGGLDALKAFFAAMPSDSGMAFVVIPHLDPNHQSMMATILSKSTEMPVVEAEDAMAIEENRVYVLPPNRYLKVVDHGLFLDMPVKKRGIRMPIDYFFSSIAETLKERSVAVILSGTGSDGSQGIRHVKAAGGLIIVQDPDTAAYDGMPRNAVATGYVDFSLPVEKMPQRLLDYAAHCETHAGEEQVADLLDGEADSMRGIMALLKNRTDYDFDSYKKNTLSRRIQRRMGLRQIKSPAEYLELLRDSPEEVQALFKDLLISVTKFFRENEAWSALLEKVLDPLIRNASKNEPVRVWVSGCATGEEAFTTAMLLQEACDRYKRESNFQVFATDLDEDAIAVARNGLYSEAIADDITPERLKKHFVAESGRYRVAKKLRERVIFAPQNLIGDAPFSRLHLITCRNLLIYLEPKIQRRVLEMFHFALRPSGYLFLGSSESIGASTGLFEAVEQKWKIFRKIGSAPATRIHFPISGPARKNLLEVGAERVGSTVEPRQDVNEIAVHTLISRFAPPSVLTNADGDIRYFHGNLSPFLELPAGPPTSHFFSYLRAPFKTKLRARFRAAIREPGGSVDKFTVRTGRDGAENVTVEILPVLRSELGERLYLVTFKAGDEADERTEAFEMPPTDDFESAAVRALEDELQSTREDLQSTIEELETSNEELKASNEEVMSMNEELQSTNEELETSREELQSINEELATVNNQLEEKVGELQQTNNDLTNLLINTDIGVVFLSTELEIRRFTPSAKGLLNIIESDLGRPIAHLSPAVDDPLLVDDAKAVLEKLTPAEAEVEGSDGRWYQRRILPYRTSDNRIDGVVITFADTTQSKLVRQRLDQRRRQAIAVAMLGQAALGGRPLEQLFDQATEALTTGLNCELAKVLKLDLASGDFIFMAGTGWEKAVAEKTRVAGGRQSQAGYTLSASPVIVEDLDEESRFQGPALLRDHKVRSGISAVIGTVSDPWGILAAHSLAPRNFSEDDINFLQATAKILHDAIQSEKLKQSILDQKRRLELALDAATMGVWEWNPVTDQTKWDGRIYELLGKEVGSIEPSSEAFLKSVVEEDRERVKVELDRAVETGDEFESEFRIDTGGGMIRWLAGVGAFNEDKSRLFGVNFDITEQKLFEHRQQVVASELDHRVKNILATVTSIANLTGRNAESVDEFRGAFASRVESMARTHNTLAESRWIGVGLRKLVNSEVKPYASDDLANVSVAGAEIMLEPRAAQCLSMALHELVTNAAKYGALSKEGGEISVHWARSVSGGEEEIIEIVWQESGGPPVRKPGYRGFGSRVIEELLRHQLKARVAVEYDPRGLRCKIELPAASVLQEGPLRKDNHAPVDHSLHREPEADSLKGVRVLVVDDEWIVAASISRALREAGATVIGPAESISSALGFIKEDKIDAAVLDFNIAGKAVTPVARDLKRRDIPFVFVTGYGSSLKRPKDFSDVPCIEKPAMPNLLINRVAELLSSGNGKKLPKASDKTDRSEKKSAGEGRAT